MFPKSLRANEVQKLVKMHKDIKGSITLKEYYHIIEIVYGDEKAMWQVFAKTLSDKQ